MFIKIISKFSIRMSLAMYAAPFNDNEEKPNIIQEKKRKNKTIKRREGFKNTINNTNNTKIEAMMKTIHNNVGDDEGEGDNLDDFNPPPPPHSVGGQRTKDRNSKISSNNVEQDDEQPDNDDVQQTENFTQLPSSYAKQYYQQYVPYFNQMSSDMAAGPNKDELLRKLDYVIHLLENQQDEKTGHVTEELILYCFLGVFVIFVVDSFARAGKYVR